ncbi:MAG: biotin--[acetyl-CoA-carboxylase] ligase, partial [Nitrospirae bacterium]|nr:biotin--[acetyl-CoA-carboxylase] ligase [Nitrospirota bacterium]
IGSTNSAAMKIADKGYPEGAVVIADAQTDGRGRLGRKWASPPIKNLYMSIILLPEMRQSEAALLTLMAAVACANAIRGRSVNALIKWPNDIIISNKKTGGILSEMSANHGKIRHVVIGVGININMDAAEMPDDIRDTATSLLIETGSLHSRTAFIIELLKEMDSCYRIFLNNRSDILRDYKRLSCMIGQPVSVNTGAETLAGYAEDIDDEGRLVLRLNNGLIKKLSAGDATLATPISGYASRC